jgi:hypothetical protein
MNDTTDLTHEEWQKARETEVKAADRAPASKDASLSDEQGVIEPPSVPKDESRESPPVRAPEDKQQQQKDKAAPKEPPTPYAWVKSERKRLKEREAALDAREAALLARDRQGGTQTQRAGVSLSGYSVEEIERYASDWEAEAERLERVGAYDEADRKRELAGQARAAIGAGTLGTEAVPTQPQQQGQTPGFSDEEIRTGWAAAEAELRAIDPDFGKDGSPLDLRLKELLAAEPVYKQHPRGIVAAYHYVSLELEKEARQAAEDRIVELQDQLNKLRSSLSVDGGSPNAGLANARGSGRRAEEMSLEELQAKLTRDAWALDSRR